MKDRDASFYFMNLASDVARCASAAERYDEKRYKNSLARARKTLTYLRHASRPEAYEEGVLMLRGLELAKESGTLPALIKQLNHLLAA